MATIKNTIHKVLTITADDTFLTVRMKKGKILAIIRGTLTATTTTIQIPDAGGTFVDVENGSFVAVAATKLIELPVDGDVRIGVKTGDKGAGDPIVSLIQA